MAVEQMARRIPPLKAGRGGGDGRNAFDVD
jgi:hypothetical protein